MVKSVNSNMDFQDLTNDLLEVSKSNDFIIGFWIRGSRAVGRETSNSDIDYIFLTKDKKDFLKVEKLLDKFLIKTNMPAYLGDGTWDEWQLKNGQDIGMRFYNYDEINYVVKNFYKNQDFFLENMDLIQNVIVESKILYDPKNKVSKLKEKIENKPQDFLLDVAERLIVRLENKLVQWVGARGIAKGPFQHISDMWHIIRELVFSHYLLNYEFSMNAMKRYHTGDLERFKPNVVKEMKIMVNIDYELTNEQEKIKTLKQIIRKYRKELEKKRAKK